MIKSTAALLRHFREMRIFFAIATAIFIFGIIVGGQSTAFQGFLDDQLDQLGQTASRLQSFGDSWVPMMLFIFLNNTVKAIVFMYLGIFFGILPIFFLLINGMVIGYLLTMLDAQGLHVGEVVLKGLLPHGILELPAIIIASAYGIRFGSLFMKKLIPSMRKKYEMRNFMRQTVTLMFYLTVTLLIAAVIESTVTPWLLEK